MLERLLIERLLIERLLIERLLIERLLIVILLLERLLLERLLLERLLLKRLLLERLLLERLLLERLLYELPMLDRIYLSVNCSFSYNSVNISKKEIKNIFAVFNFNVRSIQSFKRLSIKSTSLFKVTIKMTRKFNLNRLDRLFQFAKPRKLICLSFYN